MCGISGIYAYASGRADDRFVACACARLACRGPDGEGAWSSADGAVHLGHRRLAIIDLSPAGMQPMGSADGTEVIAFNGEIYNYRALRSELERKGCVFRSNSDTEVLLHLYRERGEAMFAALRGMYAIILWDGRNRRLVLARDPFGIKPLYMADDGRVVRVASEVKALLAGGSIDTSVEPAGHVGFFLWGHVPEPFTLFKGIRALEPGTMLAVGPGGVRRVTRFADVRDLMQIRPSEGPAEAETGAFLRDELLDTVRHHLVADVPVGIFLSAGIDSAIVTALSAEAGADLRTVTMGFDEFRGTANDETVLAHAVARRYGARHETVWIGRADFREALPDILRRMDQPTVDGVNSYFVARAAAQAGLKVALSGLGGDELFAGYPTFRDVPRLVRLARTVPGSLILGRATRRIAAPFLGFTSPKYAGVLEYGGTYPRAYLLRRSVFMPWELPKLLHRDLAEAGLRDLDYERRAQDLIAGAGSPRLRVSALEAGLYMRSQLLRDTDWASMSHSVEVRVPFVDWTFWRRTIAPLTRAGLTKQDVARLLRPTLPDEVLRRAKTGFYTPVRSWLEQELGPAWGERGLRGWARYVYSQATGMVTAP